MSIILKMVHHQSSPAAYVYAAVYKSINQFSYSLTSKSKTYKTAMLLVWFVKAGKIIRSFFARDGCEVVLRTPKWEDLDDSLELINSLVEERADITRTKRVSREEEIDWLSRGLSRLEKDETFYMVAEVDGKVVGVSEVNRRLGGYETHVGALGIAIRNGFRNLGIGIEMMKTLVERAQRMDLKVLTLSAFATNERAIHVYEKVGFVQTGRIPKKFFKDGKYIDEVIMTKVLE